MRKLFEKLLNDINIAYSIGQRKATGTSIHKLGNKVFHNRNILHNLINDADDDWFIKAQSFEKFSWTVEEMEKRVAMIIMEVEDFERFVNKL